MLPGMVAVAAAATLLYAPLGAGLARQWYDDPASSHGVALAIAAAVVLWRRRAALRALPVAPANAGFALLAASLILHMAGTFAGELFVLRVSALASLAACVLTLAGSAHLRLLAAPLVLLLLAIPLPATLVTSLTLPLQLFASQMAAGLLGTAGITAIREGNLITLSTVTLEVADVCSGLRSIVSLVAMIAMAKTLIDMPVRQAATLAVAAVPIAIAGNTLRVAGTGILAHLFGAGAARGLVHDLTGYAAFFAMGAALLGIYLLMTRRERPSRAEGETCDSRALAW
ncbi:MAG: exosortase/archaeosortase family protein [Vicinamibacterales bacterium]